MEAACLNVLACSTPLSVRTVQAELAVRWGSAFNTNDVAAFLRERRAGNDVITTAIPNPVFLLPENGAVGNEPITQGALFGPPVVAGKKKARKPEVPQPWVVQLREQVKVLATRELHTLDPQERFLVARHHAAVFAFCRGDEVLNKSKSRAVATSLSALIDYLRRRGLALSVLDYFRAATRYHDRTGNGMWFRAYDVVTELQEPPA